MPGGVAGVSPIMETPYADSGTTAPGSTTGHYQDSTGSTPIIGGKPSLFSGDFLEQCNQLLALASSEFGGNLFFMLAQQHIQTS